MSRVTSWQLVAALVVIAGTVAFVVTRQAFGSLPPATLTAPVLLAILAVAEVYVALTTRARLARRTGTKPIAPLVVARLVALAKASSLVGSLATGGYAGYVGVVAMRSSTVAGQDLIRGAVGLAASVALTAAALALERVCRIRGEDDPAPRGR